MSISSVLAFVLAGVAAKAKSVQVARRSEDRVAELWAEHLHAENVELKRRVAELEDAIATANVQARRDQELIDIWRERALGRPPQVALQQAAAQMQAAQMQAQQNILAQHNAQQNQQLGQAVGLLGAQTLIDAELFCNCVPARHDMFLRGR
jgi:cell division protein FtsB